MSLLEMRIKGRLYSGFGMLVMFVLALAVFAVWKMAAIQSEVGKMTALSGNTVRVMEVSTNLQAIRRAILRYNFDADEASFRESAERESKTIQLLQDAAKATLSEERRATYNRLVGMVEQLRAKREALGEAVKMTNAGRAMAISANETLAAAMAKVTDAARATGDRTLADGAADLDVAILQVRLSSFRFMAARDGKLVATFQTNMGITKQQIAKLQQTADLPQAVRASLDAINTQLDAYAKAFETMSSSVLAANRLYNEDVRKLTVGSLDIAATAEASLRQGYDAAKTDVDDTISGAITMQSIVAVLAILFGCVVAFFIARAISGPLMSLCGAMKELGAGNFDVVLPGLGRKDEIGEIAGAVEEFKVKAAEKAVHEADETLRRQKAEAEAQAEIQAQQAAERTKVAEEQARVVSLIGDGLRKLSDGDLTFRLTDGFSEAYKQVKDDFNTAMTRLQDTIVAIAAAAKEVAGATAEISSGTTDLSQRTEEQAASLEQTSASMEQLASTVKKNAESAQQANQFAGGTGQVADRGGQLVAQAVNAMARIEESSRKISDIISVIDEIARQTNLLALNAAVEAARAGEAGRGFAVVASEVRSLAQRSSQAAKDIKDLITNSSGQVQEGVELVNRAGASLTEIVDSIKRVAAIVADIAAASVEQSTGIDQVNTALSQMDEATQQNSALVEQSAAAAKTLEQHAGSMDQRVTYFKVAGGARGAGVQPVAIEQHKMSAAPKAKPAVQARTQAAPKRVAMNGSGRAAAAAADTDWKEF